MGGGIGGGGDIGGGGGLCIKIFFMMEFTVCLQVVKLAITTLATQPRSPARRVYPAVLTRHRNADVTSHNHAQ